MARTTQFSKKKEVKYIFTDNYKQDLTSHFFVLRMILIQRYCFYRSAKDRLKKFQEKATGNGDVKKGPPVPAKKVNTTIEHNHQIKPPDKTMDLMLSCRAMFR